MPYLEFHLLGPPAIRRAHQPVREGAYDKSQALLFYLAMTAESPLRRDVVAEMFWPDQGSGQARLNLRQALHKLRLALNQEREENPLQVNRNTVGLTADRIWVDARQFLRETRSVSLLSDPESLKRAVALYRGEFLEGFALNADLPEFEGWVETTRERLHQRALTAVAALAEGCERRGALSEALLWTEREVEIAPLNEAGQQRRMRLLALAGRKAEAVAQFARYRTLLMEELGVGPSAETLALLRDIQQNQLQPAPQHALPSAAPSASPSRDRRELTVLCCELTPPATADPEEWADQLEELEQLWERQIRAHGGHAVPIPGGSHLAYFGYPTADERATHRAVHAALKLREGLLESAPGLQAAIAVHVGICITAPNGIPDRVGDISKAALALARTAPSNTVSLSEPVAHRVRGYFTLEPSSELGTEGWTATAVLPVEERLDATGPPPTPLIGRTGELGCIDQLWSRVQAGETLTVFMQGEPGMGKTRLVRQLSQRYELQAGRVLEARCSAGASGTPLHPLRRLLRERLGLQPDHGRPALSRAIEARMSQLGLDAEEQEILVGLVGRGLAEQSAPAPQDDLAQRLFTTVAKLVRELAGYGPLLVILEDLHWADPTTLSLVRELEASGAPMLLVMTARPEFVLGWHNRRLVRLDLPALSPEHARAMVAALTDGKALAPATVDAIVRQGSGVPLFIEELVCMTLEGVEPTGIPPNLRGLLGARLDRLGPARQLIQQAAVFGTSCSLRCLHAVAQLPPPVLEEQIATLLESGLLFAADIDGEPGYRFKHALIQETAYASLVRADRRRIHQRVAQALQSEAAAMVRDRPEVLARHLTEAEAYPEAVAQWLAAGRLACRRAADREAVTHLQTALQLLEKLPADEERAQLELDLLLALGPPMVSTIGYGSDEVKACYRRAETLSRELDKRFALFVGLYGQWLTASSRSGYAEALAVAEQMLAIAEESEESLLRYYAHAVVGSSYFWLGAFELAREHLERSIALHDPQQHDATVFTFGDSPAVTTRCILAWQSWMEGRGRDTAERLLDEALEVAQRIGHKNTIGYALTFVAGLPYFAGDAAQADQHAQTLKHYAREHNLALWLGTGHMMHGWARAAAGVAEGVDEVAAAAKMVRQVMRGVEQTFMAALARARAASGDLPGALADLDATLALIEQDGCRYHEPELHRLRGQWLMALAPAERARAEHCFRRALGQAQAQGAGLFELRAALDLARLYESSPLPADLAETVSALTERYRNRPDLPEAAAIAALAARDPTAEGADG